MTEKAVEPCLETKEQLKDQMVIPKKNRDNVPLDVLKTKYRKGHTTLCKDLRLLTSDFIKPIVFKDIATMPKYMPGVVQIVETTVKDFDLLKECSKVAYRQQDFEELKSLAEQFRELTPEAPDELHMKRIGFCTASEYPKGPYPPSYYLNLVTSQYYDGTRRAKI